LSERGGASADPLIGLARYTEHHFARCNNKDCASNRPITCALSWPDDGRLNGDQGLPSVSGKGAPHRCLVNFVPGCDNAVGGLLALALDDFRLHLNRKPMVLCPHGRRRLASLQWDRQGDDLLKPVRETIQSSTAEIIEDNGKLVVWRRVYTGCVGGIDYRLASSLSLLGIELGSNLWEIDRVGRRPTALWISAGRQEGQPSYLRFHRCSVPTRS
jgi:hypothetical protein